MGLGRTEGPQPPRCRTKVPHRRWGSMAGNFIERSRHGRVFYFRRRVPGDLVDLLGKRHIYVTLQTHERRTALMRARELAVHTDSLFEEMRKAPNKLPPGTDSLGRIIDGAAYRKATKNRE